MEGLRQWTVMLCAAAVACTVLERLFPDTALGRQGRQLLPCVFLCILLSPLLTLRWNLPLTTNQPATAADTAMLEARVRQQTVRQMNGTLLNMVNQALESYGVQAKKVVTDMDIDEDGSIHMGQITVYVDRKTARRSVLVKQVAESRLGTAVTVAQMEEIEP